MSLKRISLALVLVLFLALTTVTQSNPAPLQIGTRGFAPVTQYSVEIINTYPHDPTAFTQGLLLSDNGTFYESTGLRGQSTLREVEIETGEVIRQISVMRSQEDLDAGALEYFAEGLELIGDNLIQLTWQANEAFIYDQETFEQLGTVDYLGEGWGLCYDGNYLYMSDSSEYISIREADTFELIGRMLVTIQGRPIESQRLNELECVGDYIYANLWQTDFIVQIDNYNGNVVGIIDAAGLMTEEMILEIPGASNQNGTVVPPSGAVLNGIAYDDISETFFITGKLWSRMFEVRFTQID